MNGTRGMGVRSVGGVVQGEAEQRRRIERVVAQLNALGRIATFSFAIAVGRVIVDGFYGGDLHVWRTRGPKDASFRRLAKHPNLPMSPSSLYRSVAIYELCERLEIRRCKSLSTSHFRLVLPLPAGLQESLLRRAEAGAWSVAELTRQIEALGPIVRTSRGGRKAKGQLRRTVHTLERCVHALGMAMTTEEDREPSPDTMRSLLALTSRMRAACDVIEQRAQGWRGEIPATTSETATGRT